MFMPPSNKTQMRAIVTRFSTSFSDGACRLLITFAATADATSSSSGVGTFNRSLSRFDITAARKTKAVNSTASAKCSVSLTEQSD